MDTAIAAKKRVQTLDLMPRRYFGWKIRSFTSPNLQPFTHGWAISISLIVAEVLHVIEDDTENCKRNYWGKMSLQLDLDRSKKIFAFEFARCELINRLWNEEISKLLYQRIIIRMYVGGPGSRGLYSINRFSRIIPSRRQFMAEKVHTP